MSRNEFLEELGRLLYELPIEEREEAIRYYDSYFEEAGADQEQVVLDELGSAERIAKQILRDYRMENGGGIYTEHGYSETESKTQIPKPYVPEENRGESTGTGSGVTITKKGLSGGTLVALILLAVLTFPIWISVFATLFGLLMGLFGACIGITFGFGIGGIACIIGAVVAFAFGIFKTFTIPVVGAGLVAMALILFGVGCLMLAAVGGIIKLTIWAFKGIINLLGRIFHGKKVA